MQRGPIENGLPAMNRVSCGSRESAGAPPTLQLPEDTVRVDVLVRKGTISNRSVYSTSFIKADASVIKRVDYDEDRLTGAKCEVLRVMGSRRTEDPSYVTWLAEDPSCVDHLGARALRRRPTIARPTSEVTTEEGSGTNAVVTSPRSSAHMGSMDCPMLKASTSRLVIHWPLGAMYPKKVSCVARPIGI